MNKKQIFLSYLALIHLFLGVILLKSDFISRLQSELGFTMPDEHYRRMLIIHKSMDRIVPEKAVILIGDSLIQRLAGAAVSPLSINFGIGGDTTEGVLQRIPEYQSLKRAKAIVLLVGYNDLHMHINAQIIHNYQAILEGLPSDIPIVVSAVLPVDQKAIQEADVNQRIKEVNSAIEVICRQYPNISFINLAPKLVDNTGNLADKYHVGDGIHLSSKGYGLWIDAIKEVL